LKAFYNRVWGIAAGSASLALLLTAVSASGHHSAAMFDRTKTLTLEGVVKEFQYTNPHTWLIVDVTHKDGTTRVWGFEGGHRNAMLEAGIYKNDLPPGTAVTVTAHPMNDGRPAGTWEKVVRGDGTVLDPHAAGGN
jgi:hypothetical protein